MRKLLNNKRMIIVTLVLATLSVTALSYAIAATKSAFNLNSPASFPVDI